ncbi:hypothetical protein POM88_032231 [Heracleum sosnowskyi]|uniref:Uncharacterized protein n=1 Tax=Heracleum sosnowskyi TaxID=360622 RepID=A0AAD8ML19_9APIA|nr:hypothetical protein POM88_032231 [Heracleum sosnowskyi]
MKARYFPSSSILNAGLGNNPSYVWRSILAAKDLICSGSVLKVGNGEDISIWNDPWIPVYGSTRVQTSVVQGLEDAKVSNLFKTGLNEWDYDLLRDIFNQEDVERIVKIPVAHTNQGADKWIWSFSCSNGGASF